MVAASGSSRQLRRWTSNVPRRDRMFHRRETEQSRTRSKCLLLRRTELGIPRYAPSSILQQPNPKRQQAEARVPHSLPKLAQTHLLVLVPVQYLGRRQLEIFLRHMHSPLSERIHACFRAHTLQLCSTASTHLLSNLSEIDTSRQIHRPAVDTQNVCSGFGGWRREFNLPVDTAWT